jgi:hypothetical protein
MSRSPKLIFNDLLQEIVAPALKGRGYSRRRNSFYLCRGSNCGLINFQKSVASNKDRLSFTINLGIASGRLLDFLSAKRRGLGLTIDDCHWASRIGALLPPRHDKWWTINCETSLEDMGRGIVRCLMDIATPEIEKYLSDDALRNLWLSGKSPGLTSFQRLVYLSALLKIIGPRDLLQKTIQEMKLISESDPPCPAVAYYLSKLEKVSP